MTDDPVERGLTAYREGRFFDAHEHWEERWRTEPDPDRRLMLQALVQLAAALHKLHSGIRPRGAPALLERAAAKLARLDAPVLGLDPAVLRERIHRLSRRIREPQRSGAAPDAELPIPEL